MNNLPQISPYSLLFTQNPAVYYSNGPFVMPNDYLPQNLLLPPSVNLETSLAQLRQKYEELLLQNEDLKKKLQNATSLPHIHQVKRKFIRRKEDQIDKQHRCCYGSCKKEYASVLALNLHIKTKHKGGTKKQRDQLAKSIVLAQINGKQTPRHYINLPQGYVQRYKREHFAVRELQIQRNTSKI